MKILPSLLLFVFAAALAPAETITAKITEQTKMEFTKSKGGVTLKAGTPIEITGQDGDSLEVTYRNISGRVPRASTDFKGEAPKVAPAAVVAPAEPKPAAPAPKPTPPPTTAATKPAETKPAAPVAPANPPTTMYGKAVQKARENEAKHKENLVDPTDDSTGAKK